MMPVSNAISIFSFSRFLRGVAAPHPGQQVTPVTAMASEAVEEAVGDLGGWVDGGAGVDDASSLFEGMVLFDASHLLPPTASPPPPPSPPVTSPVPDDGQEAAAQPPLSAPSSQPLDEDLFSDLTVLTPSTPAPSLSAHPAPSASPSARAPPTAPSDIHPAPAGPASAATPETPPLAPPSRQVSRKKKRAIRIGYARGPASGWLGSSAAAIPPEDEADTDPSPLSLPESYSAYPQRHMDLSAGSSPSSLQLDSPSTLSSQSRSGVAPVAIETTPVMVVVDKGSHPSEDSPVETGRRVGEEEEQEEEGHHPPEAALEERQQHQQQRQIPRATPPEQEENSEDAVASSEGKLDKIRAQISEKLGGIRKTVALLSEERKVLRRRCRKATDSMHAVSTKYKELERELEEACEVEDFERAERVSESLAAAEKEKDELVKVLRGAEEDCDAVDLKMQEVLEMQISAEEEGVVLLEQFSKDAAESAELILRDATEICSEEMKKWHSSTEDLQARKLEMGIASQVVDGARGGLVNSIEQVTEDDRTEKEILSKKGDVLAKELDELLVLFKQKEAQIAENRTHIQEVEERISKVVSEFQEAQSAIDAKCNDMQLALLKMESEGDDLSQKKKEIDESLSLADQKGSKLKELAHLSLDEAKTCHDLLAERKSMASYVLKSRENKVRLAKTEEKISEEIQILRQQISSARSYLQELSSNRASIQEEVAVLKQRISFIGKRGPELEAEKKVAAAARNFKEAGRIAAEVKALSLEKENVQLAWEKGISDLEKVEEEIRSIIDNIQESEMLILSKEKEAAIARCERLYLVAATARAERSASLESGDSEEGEILLLEAEAAESEARELQQKYEFESETLATIPKSLLSTSIITNLSRETASSFNIPLTSSL